MIKAYYFLKIVYNEEINWSFYYKNVFSAFFVFYG